MKTELVVAGYIFDKNRVLLIYHKQKKMWLPVGGHIDKNETPDNSLMKEAKEECNLDIKILNKSKLPITGDVIRNLSIPFEINVHRVPGHYHCCLFYVAIALNPNHLKLKKDEVLEYRWLSKEDIGTEKIPEDVRNEALLAFDIYKKLK